MFVAGLKTLLESDYDIVATVYDGAALVKQAQRLKPALVVADVSMPELSGIDATRLLHQTLPDVKIVLLTMHSDAELAHEAFSAGAAAYVLKRDAPDVLMTALRQVLSGKSGFVAGQQRCPPKTAGPRTMLGRSDLSSRQVQILRLISQGYPQKQIAAQLHISPKTVEFHKYKLMRQLGVHTTAQLVAVAVRKGWTGP
jgi:DNA-binding NarL/FixJ family response regulator